MMRNPSTFRRTYILLGMVLVLLLACNSLPLFPPTATPTPTATSTQTPTATPTPIIGDWQSILIEDFNSNSNGWNLETSTGELGTVEFSISGGTFNWDVNSVSPNGLMMPILAPIDALTDCLVSMTGQELDGASDARYGLVLRSTNSSSYIFDINQQAQTYSFVTNASGTWEFPFNQVHSDAIHPSGPNKLSVKAEGGDFALVINGTEVNLYHTNLILTGKAGLVTTILATGSASFSFDSFSVYAP